MTRSGRPLSQRADELSAFINLLRDCKVRSYLEIGARHGDTFFEVMTSLPEGSKGVTVDLPGGPWGADSRAALEDATADLCLRGYDITTIWGDSRSSGVRQLAMASGPYDAILIDGDHAYEAVKEDWEHYGPMGQVVAFHDIDGEGMSTKGGHVVEVPRLWSEIRASGLVTAEIIGETRGMGIGVVFR